MKKNILLPFFFVLTCLGLSMAQDALQGSRLGLANKKKVAKVNYSKLALTPNNFSLKPFESNTPAALNSYYRSLLFPEKTPVASSVAKEPTVASTVYETVHNPAIVEEKAATHEEYLYTSDQISISNIYPNPASDKAELDYAITGNVREAKIMIYNVLGASVGSYNLSKMDRKLYVNTREMPTGVYFYQLSIEGKKVATKKMLVRHQ